MEKICKIVYFDEDSVTDYVQIVAGGELENTTELLKSRDAKEEQNVQANGKVGISGIFKALLGWEAGASADVAAGLSFNSSKMVKNIVKNTILTDFLKTIEDASSGKSASRLPKGTIKQFKGYKISAEEDSLSYMVMVSPYLSIIHNWYDSILVSLKEDERMEIQKTDILDWFVKNADRYDNIRILKTKLENAIFDRLAETFIIS